jgi:hypothetical protein
LVSLKVREESVGLLAKLFGRKNNPALNFILSNFAEHTEIDHLVAVLPDLARLLYAGATENAREMQSRALGRNRSLLLIECILDLELVAGFDEVVNYVGDIELASCYIDAVLFEATKQEPGPEPTQDQYLNEGTQECRGLAKYSMAKHYFKVPDPAGWLFGKEYAAILSGNPKDIAIISSVLPHTIKLRDMAKVLTRSALRAS